MQLLAQPGDLIGLALLLLLRLLLLALELLHAILLRHRIEVDGLHVLEQGVRLGRALVLKGVPAHRLERDLRAGARGFLDVLHLACGRRSLRRGRGIRPRGWVLALAFEFA